MMPRKKQTRMIARKRDRLLNLLEFNCEEDQYHVVVEGCWVTITWHTDIPPDFPTITKKRRGYENAYLAICDEYSKLESALFDL